MKRNPDQLSESEWNFVPLIHRHPTPAERHELRAAIYYEYARESDSLRELARQYAALKAGGAGKAIAELERPLSDAFLLAAEAVYMFEVVERDYFAFDD